MDNKALTMTQFQEIMNRIIRKHRFGHFDDNMNHGRWIKYVRPQFDMRDLKCWRITFDNIAKTFDFRDEGKMYDNIMKWLEEGEKNA